MNLQKTLLATLAGGAILFGLGLLIYVVIFGNASINTPTAPAGVINDPPAFGAIIVMELLFGFLLALIYGRWAGIKTFATGMKAGAVIGLIIGLTMALEYIGITSLYPVTYVLFSGITYALRFAVAGGVIGAILGRGTDS